MITALKTTTGSTAPVLSHGRSTTRWRPSLAMKAISPNRRSSQRACLTAASGNMSQMQKSHCAAAINPEISSAWTDTSGSASAPARTAVSSSCTAPPRAASRYPVPSSPEPAPSSKQRPPKQGRKPSRMRAESRDCQCSPQRAQWKLISRTGAATSRSSSAEAATSPEILYTGPS